jgi:hypothetical protein
MQLRNVVEREDLEQLYEKNNLTTCEQKIAYLVATMKIRAMRCDEEESPEENLAGLEEVALLGDWKALQ